MKKFEYKIIDLPDPTSIDVGTDQLNKFGADGWELCKAVGMQNTTPPMARMIFKREITTEFRG